MFLHYITLLASVYGEGVYGEGLYSADAAASDGGSSSGGLADTGTAVVALVTLACLIIFVALLVRHIGKRRNKKYTARKRR